MGCVRYLRAPPRFAGTWALRGACGERGWAATGRAAGRAGQGETKVLLLLLPRVGGVQGCVGRAVGGGGELRPGWLRGVQLSRVLRSVRTQSPVRASAPSRCRDGAFPSGRAGQLGAPSAVRCGCVARGGSSAVSRDRIGASFLVFVLFYRSHARK